GKLADATDLSVPFYLGAATFVVAIPVLATGHKLLRQAESRAEEGEQVGPVLTPVTAPAAPGAAPVLVAVGAHERADGIVDA
ncbi:MFS transporter, partial [Xylella fastidiosa subsp. multiplex]|nr:MFS transporter [Xylella fastidiosa subsp. multiplex]